MREATIGVAAVGALPLGFRPMLGIVQGKFLPVGMHAVEASYVSALSVLRAAIVRAVWSGKMPLAGALVFLNLLDGPVGGGFCCTHCLGQVQDDALVSGVSAS